MQACTCRSNPNPQETAVVLKVLELITKQAEPLLSMAAMYEIWLNCILMRNFHFGENTTSIHAD